jgi:hypothetical protein
MNYNYHGFWMNVVSSDLDNDEIDAFIEEWGFYHHMLACGVSLARETFLYRLTRRLTRAPKVKWRNNNVKFIYTPIRPIPQSCEWEVLVPRDI